MESPGAARISLVECLRGWCAQLIESNTANRECEVGGDAGKNRARGIRLPPPIGLTPAQRPEPRAGILNHGRPSAGTQTGATAAGAV